ncbi:hypothetical protein [Sandaracinus amylolyticus]|uniref:hypothetical protein n=1 Tax=Sandaracinus amylolyticus TaxID=927083 RepID=UPI001F21B1D2|nr:hypothetical protein [Sandaracinus amylolyticus]UJR86297.1 Hypothetical protein I5071_83810 [Sandaracinus amylolyticus]
MTTARSLLLCVVLAGCGARTDLGVPPPVEPFDAGPPPIDAGHDAPPPIDAPRCVLDADCDDRLDCTLDRCIDGSCVAEPVDMWCDDALFCTGVERCDVRLGCVASPPACGDAIACTVDVCDETLDACVREPDADLCPISHRCDPTLGCVARALAHDRTRLYEIDLPSGALRELAPTPVTLTDLALHPDGTLYGAVAGTLVRVDPEAGTVDRLVDVMGAFVGLDISPDGTLYGSVDDRVVRFDLARGTATRVATFPGGLRASGDLAFVEGRLYATVTGGRGGDWLVEVPLDGGTRARVIGATGEDAIWGLAPFGATLYGLTRGGALLRIDVTNARTTVLARPGAEFFGGGAR